MIAALVTSAVLASTTAPDEVVVYPDRAQVVRETKITCGSGVNVTFENVPPAAGADSFRAHVTLGSVDGLRAELETREKEFGPKAEALTAQLEKLVQEREALEDVQTRADLQARLGMRYGEVASTLAANELADERPNPKAWQAAFDAALTTGTDAAKNKSDVDAKLRELARKEAELRRQLSEVEASRQKQAWTVEVLVSCPKGQSATVGLKYLVGGASWTPVYEARAEEKSSLVALSTFATITQTTGEDWKGVKLTLSTAVPSQNATPPDLKKLKVGAQEREPEKKVLVRREEAVQRADTGEGGEAATEGGLRARSQGLSVQLTVPEPGQVPGDGQPVRLFVGRTKLKAHFELRVLPKLMPVAFRVAELVNQAAWPLLPGRLDAFRETGLVGRYRLPRVAQGAPFTLTFGVEDEIRVKRTVLEELKRDTGFMGSTRRFSYSYKFEVANYGKSTARVVLQDHVPVSEQKDIKVTVDEKTTRGYKMDADDGIAKWPLAVKPQEKQTVQLTFKVEVPDSYETGGL